MNATGNNRIHAAIFAGLLAFGIPAQVQAGWGAMSKVERTASGWVFFGSETGVSRTTSSPSFFGSFMLFSLQVARPVYQVAGCSATSDGGVISGDKQTGHKCRAWVKRMTWRVSWSTTFGPSEKLGFGKHERQFRHRQSPGAVSVMRAGP